MSDGESNESSEMNTKWVMDTLDKSTFDLASKTIGQNCVANCPYVKISFVDKNLSHLTLVVSTFHQSISWHLEDDKNNSSCPIHFVSDLDVRKSISTDAVRMANSWGQVLKGREFSFLEFKKESKDSKESKEDEYFLDCFLVLVEKYRKASEQYKTEYASFVDIYYRLGRDKIKIHFLLNCKIVLVIKGGEKMQFEFSTVSDLEHIIKLAFMTYVELWEMNCKLSKQLKNV